MIVADLASRLRVILAGRVTDADAIRDTARQWADLLASARRRLDFAADWARRGLRSEALDLAAAAPSIYSIAEASRDPSLAEWPSFCARQRLPTAPELPSELLDLLSECHLQEEPIREALARWRKLNVGRAPATERLDQMRLLRGLDPGNPSWTTDAPPLERAALAEAIEASERGLALWEIERVQAIVRWIEQGEWLDAPSADAVGEIRRRIRALSGRSALERARDVVDRLHQEYMAESIDAAAAHLREWDALRAFLADSGVEPPAELTASVQPVVEWIRERHERAQRAAEQRTSIAELAAAVESPHTSQASLEKLLARVLAGPEPPPSPLVAATRRRLADFRRGRTIRRALAVVAVLVVIALLGVAAKAMLDRHARRLAGERLLVDVQDWIDKDDLVAAKKALHERREADPDLHEHPAVDDAARRIDEAVAAQSHRDAEFRAALIAAGDPGDLSAVPITATPAGRDGARDRTEELLALARTAAQREEVEAWRGARARALSARQEALDARFTAALTALEDEFGRALAPPATDGTARAREGEAPGRAPTGDGPGSAPADAVSRASLERFLRRLDDLERSPGVSTAVALRARPLRIRLEALARTAEDRRALEARRESEQAALANLAALVREPDALAATLLRFADDFPDSPHAEGFRDAVIDAPAWRGALAWPAVRTAAAGRLASAGGDERAEAERRLMTFIEEHPLAPDSETARRALDFLHDQDEWRRWMIGVLDGSPIMALRSVELRTGERYYYEESSAPQPASDGQRVYRIVRSLRDPAQGLFDAEYVRLDPKRIVADGESPQRRFAQLLRAELRAGGLTGVPGALEVIRRWRDATTLDPVLRAEILIGLLRELRLAAPVLAADADQSARRLESYDPEHVTWLDPRDAHARERAREIEATLPRTIEVDRWSDLWRRELADAERRLAEAFEPAGILLVEEGAARWLPDGAPAPGPLFAIRVDGATSRMVEVGHADATNAVRLATSSAPPPSGTLLFRRRAAPAPGAPTARERRSPTP